MSLYIPPTGIPKKAVELGPYKMFALYAVFSLISILITAPQQNWLNWYLSIVWSLHLLVAAIGLFQAISSPKITMSTFKKTVDKKIIFLIPTVGRKDTLPALNRVVDSVIEHAPKNLDNFMIDIVIEDHSEAKQYILRKYNSKSNVRVLIVPANYSTEKGTKYKARANQYALEVRRSENDNTPNTYVYHLDDDTHVEEDTISSIAEFISKNHGDLYLAQGVLTFPHELSPSWICKMADSVRPADDVMRFRFFTGSLGTPLGGLHGEHLLIRSDIEDEITWDFGDVLVEDAYFGLNFAEKYPHRSGLLNSYSYGASPGSLRDLIKQRRRWSHGLQRLIIDRRFPLRLRLPLIYFVTIWAFGLFQFVGLVLLVAYITGLNNTSPVFTGVLFVWCFNLAYFMWQYVEGLKINISVSKVSYSKTSFIGHSFLIMPLMFYFTLIEGFASFLGILQWFSKEHEFQVIRKEY